MKYIVAIVIFGRIIYLYVFKALQNLLYFFNNPKVQIRAYWPVNPNELPKDVTEISKKMPTYFVFNENQKEINNDSLKLIQKIKKGSGDSYMRLYQVIPR